MLLSTIGFNLTAIKKQYHNLLLQLLVVSKKIMVWPLYCHFWYHWRYNYFWIISLFLQAILRPETTVWHSPPGKFTVLLVMIGHCYYQFFCCVELDHILLDSVKLKSFNWSRKFRRQHIAARNYHVVIALLAAQATYRLPYNNTYLLSHSSTVFTCYLQLQPIF